MNKGEHFDFYGKVVDNKNFTDNGWANPEKAGERYEAVAELINSREDIKTVADYGCGAGHLYQYVGKKYTGFDIFPDFVEKAQRLYPSGEFIQIPVDSTNVDPRLDNFDAVVMIGTYSMKCSMTEDDYRDYVLSQLQEMLKRDIKYVILVGFRKQNDWEDDHLYYTDINYLMRLADSEGVTVHLSNFMPNNFIAIFEK